MVAGYTHISPCSFFFFFFMERNEVEFLKRPRERQIDVMGFSRDCEFFFSSRLSLSSHVPKGII